MAVLIVVALVAGYAGVAAFVSLRVIVAAAVFGALYLLLVVTQTLFAAINEQTAKGQMLAESLGISARSLGLSGALLSALIRVMLIVLGFPADHRPVGSVHRRPVRHRPQHSVRF